jgi:hypothetical protein
MARKLYYKIADDGRSVISDDQWQEISRLQHWYNSEFVWTAGKLALKMYLVFLNHDHRQLNHHGLEQAIQRLRDEYKLLGCSEREIIRQLEERQLIIVKQGGYFDGCIASGVTRVANNEFNAYLVCEFLLRISYIIPEIVISVSDEGSFIKPKGVNLQGGDVRIRVDEKSKLTLFQNIVEHRHAFSIVDAAKYDECPQYSSLVPGFNGMSREERRDILHEWNWLGFESNYDMNGDDIQGYNLNEKVKSFGLE